MVNTTTKQSGWVETTLGEVADVQTGPFGSQLHEEDYVIDGTPIITVEHLVEDRIVHTSDVPRVSISDKNRLKRYILEEGDVVFSRVGSVDRCGYVSEKEKGWLFSGRLLRVRPYDELDKKYAFYWLASPSIKSLVRKVAVGATMPSINTQLLSRLPISFPSLPEQRAIAAVLSSLDDKIELLRKQNKTLEETAQAIFREWFGRYSVERAKELPKGWKVGIFTDIIEILSGGTPKTNIEEYWDGEIPFFTPKDAKDTCYVLDTEKTITEVGLAKCNSRLYPKNTVFITARGTVGKCALSGRDMAMNQSCYALNGKNISNYFVFLLTKKLIENIQKSASGAVFDAITVSTFESILVVIPHQNFIVELHKVFSPMFEKILSNLEQIKTISTLRDALLPRLLRGEVRVKF